MTFLTAVLLFTGIGQSVIAATKPQIVLTLGREDEEHPDVKWTKLVFTEAFERLDMEFVYKGYPTKRAFIMADAGEVDGILSQPQEERILLRFLRELLRRSL